MRGLCFRKRCVAFALLPIHTTKSYTSYIKQKYCAKHLHYNFIRKVCMYDYCHNLTHINMLNACCNKHALFVYPCRKKRLCQADGCSITANYGLLNKNKTYCAKHVPTEYKLRKMKDTSSDLPTYNTKKKCITNNLPLYINKSRKICKAIGCTITASYGLLKKSAEYCTTHKTSSLYFNKTRKMCIVDGCTSYTKHSQRKDSKYCSKHII